MGGTLGRAVALVRGVGVMGQADDLPVFDGQAELTEELVQTDIDRGRFLLPEGGQTMGQDVAGGVLLRHQVRGARAGLGAELSLDGP